MDKKILKKRLLKILLWTAVSLSGLFLIFLIFMMWFLSSSHLTSMAEEYANEYLKADVKIGKVDWSIGDDFPYIAVDVESVEIVSHAFNSLKKEEKSSLPTNCDTLLVADKMHAEINILDAVSGVFNLKNIKLDGAEVNFVAYSADLNNADILPPDDGEPFEIPEITFDKIEISEDSKVELFSLEDFIKAEVDIKSLILTDAKNKKYNIDYDGKASLNYDEVQVFKDIPLCVDTKLDFDIKNFTKVDINNCDIKFGDIPVNFNVKIDFTKDFIIERFKLRVGEFSVNNLKKYFAEEYVGILEIVDTNIRGTLNVELDKPYIIGGEEPVPSISIKMDIPDSYLKDYSGRELKSFKLLAEAKVNGENIDESFLRINNLLLKGKSVYLKAKGKFTNPISNPHASGDVNFNVDLAEAINVFSIPVPEESEVNGKAKADVKFNFDINDIINKYYDKLMVSGNLELTDFAVKSPSDTIDLYVDLAKFSFGSKEKIADIDSLKETSIFKATFSLDSLNLDYLGTNVKIRNAMIALGGIGNLAKFGEKGHIMPVGGEIRAQNIRIVDADSMRINFNDLICYNSIRLTKDSHSVPFFDFNIKAAKANYRDKMIRGGIKEGDIFLHLEPRVNDYTIRIDSLSRLYPDLDYDTIVEMAESENFCLAYEKSSNQNVNRVRGILKRWDLSGHIKAKRARLVTPYFPLRNRINNMDMAFSMDSIVINSGKYKTGRSSFDMSGGLRNLRSTFMGNKELPLKLNLVVYCDTLDANEILAAMYAGSNFSKSEAQKILDSDASDSLIEQQLISDVSDDSIKSAIVIPPNIEADIDVFAKYGKYVDLNLRDMSGGLQVRNGSMWLNEIRTSSDVGNLRFNALYSAPRKDNIDFAFDLGLDGIQLDRFIKLIPSIDSIMPLLNSMDGIVKADIAATAKLDTEMNIKLPTLVAAMKLHGDSLILFDSETFSTIAKKLRFKNKKRNLIDDMTVEIVIKDNVMELFPFMFVMDRYKFGVMGSNDLDLNFKYHISVLKSPIPFKFGINISGNPDDWKLRFGGAKYKDGRAGRISTLVEDTRINLREQMSNAFKRGARAAIKTNLEEQVEKNKIDFEKDTLSAQDSLNLMREGLIDASEIDPELLKQAEKIDKDSKDKSKKNKSEAVENRKEKVLKQD